MKPITHCPALLVLAALAHTAHARPTIPETIVYGTVYNIFHDEFETDEDFFRAVDTDMAKIKESNLNLVMPFPFGQWDSRTRQQDWTRTDHLVRRIEESGLRLMPIMLKSQRRAYLPTWKLLELPRDARNANFLHPEVQAVVEQYFASVARRYGRSPALVGYNIWNEPHYESADDIIVPLYRDWLQSKYATLAQLNRSWAEDFSSWDQIGVRSGGGWWSSMPVIDWNLFRYHLNGRVAEWCHDTMRKYDSEHFMAVNPTRPVANFEDNHGWAIDGRQIAPHCDILGISFYADKYLESGNDEPMPYWLYNCTFNSLRCDAGARPFYLVEAQTNQQNGLGLFQFMSYDDIHLMSWLALANDCKGVIFWKWKPFYRGSQSFGRGLLQGDGELAPRGLAARDVGAVLAKHGELLFKARMKPAQVGLLYDIVGMQKSFTANNPSNEATRRFMNHSYEGTFKALLDSNLSVDVVRTDMPLELADLTRYKALVMSYQLVVRKEVAALLQAYVSNGGWLLADARTAIMNELDIGHPVNPGAGLDEVFGAQRLDLFAREGSFAATVTNAATFDRLPARFGFDGVFFRETLRARAGAEVVATFDDDGAPAITANRHGKGLAVLSAVPLGGSHYHSHESAGRLLASFARASGAVPTALVEGRPESGPVLVKVHATDDGELVVYISNISENDFSGALTIPEVDRTYRAAVELTNEKPIGFVAREHELHFDVVVPAKRTAVIRFR